MGCEKTFWINHHNWGKWETVEEKSTDASTVTSVKIKYFLRQKRTCKDCGFCEIDIQTAVG